MIYNETCQCLLQFLSGKSYGQTTMDNPNVFVLVVWFVFVFTHESSYCFQCVLAIAILSVCLSVTRVDQSITVQATITKSSLSAAWKTLVSGTVKLFH